MRIVIDTREQEPYSFIAPVIRVESLDSLTSRMPLAISGEGFETRVAVERKSLSDFVNTVATRGSRASASVGAFMRN